MIPIDKVKKIIERHILLEKELSTGKVEPKLLARKSKEYSDLKNILPCAKEYIEFEKDLVTKGISSSETPDGIYFQIQITAHNMGTEAVRITGGQFHLFDTNNTKYDAVFIGYGEGELSLIDLEPNSSITVTTQFDIPYDDQMEYRVGIIPDRYGLQDYQERGFICVKNCKN